jgi:hypothetical protein
MGISKERARETRMFQHYAVTYNFGPMGQDFGTTTVVDLEEAYNLGMEEMGEARRLLIRKMIACRHLGSASRYPEVFLTEAVRLGTPTETP